jgi:hypothetical protein
VRGDAIILVEDRRDHFDRFDVTLASRLRRERRARCRGTQ